MKKKLEVVLIKNLLISKNYIRLINKFGTIMVVTSQSERRCKLLKSTKNYFIYFYGMSHVNTIFDM